MLFISETSVYRNVMLGLSREQTTEAFQKEFGVDQVAVFPTVSYHLDYDLSLRKHDGKLLAFVNDPISAARWIVKAGLGALAEAPEIDAKLIANAAARLEGGEHSHVVAELRNAVEALKTGGKFPLSLLKRFAKGSSDSPGPNFQIFLTALDLLEADKQEPARQSRETPARREYLKALRQTLAHLQEQRLAIQQQVDEIVPIPSLPDVRHSLNYINSLQTDDAVIIPAWGGMYETVDRAAAEAYRKRLGGQIQIVPVQASESLRHMGGIHCIASVFPARPKK
jgi:hypothetical protein